jgi:hypothetical protein
LNVILPRKARWIAPLIHGYVFVLTWILYWLQSQPLLDGPSRWPFALIYFGDFPFSAISFGAMFVSEKNFPYALAAWAAVGTLWWYFLGRLMERRRAVHKEQ